ncbi:MAG TPA: hypothetical protein VFU35_09065 [Jatrophihabitans sp.]|nr:hypothetical protein [Jatrophihabitans sp.]
MDPRHVLDWSTARVEWTASGFELTVSLQPGSTARLVNAVTDALQAGLAPQYRDVEVLAYEPDGPDAAAIGIVSAGLLEFDPHRLRYDVDTVADASANAVVAQAAADETAIVEWLAALRG